MKYLFWFFILSITACSTASVENPILFSEKDARPTVVVNPFYPKKAAMSGVEGYVRFKFDIDKSGFARNIQIVESRPEGVFDKNAQASISKWKFKTKLEDGKPVVQKNMIYTMEFRLAN